MSGPGTLAERKGEGERGSGVHVVELVPAQTVRPDQEAFLEATPQAAAVQVALVRWINDSNPERCFAGQGLLGEIEYRLRFEVYSEPEQLVARNARFVEVVEGMPVPDEVVSCVEAALAGRREFQPQSRHRAFLANYSDDFDIRAGVRLGFPGADAGLGP